MMITNMYKYNTLTKNIFLILCFGLFSINFAYAHNIERNKIEKIIQTFLIKNPQVLKSSLSEDSYTAAAAVLTSKKQNLYREFHLSLMNTKGRINENTIFKNAAEIGLNINKLKLDMNDPEIQLTLKKNREVAKSLELNGTPAFIIGDIIYPGAINKNQLKKAIKLYRKS